MVAFHEIDVVVFVLGQVWLKLTRNTMLSPQHGPHLAASGLYFCKEILNIGPSNSIHSLNKLIPLTTFMMLNIQIKKSILIHIKLKYIRYILLCVVNQVRVLIYKVMFIRSEVISSNVELAKD